MVRRIIQWKKSYIDEDGNTCIPVKTKGKKKFRCDECGEKVREVFTINPTELLSKKELCRGCYVKTPESLEILLSQVLGDEDVNFTVKDDFLDNLGEPYVLPDERLEGIKKGETYMDISEI